MKNLLLPHSSVLALTGHRPDKVGGYVPDNPLSKLIKNRMRWEITTIRPKKIITGMGLGVDTWGAELAIELNIPFLAAVPCEGQEKTWRRVEDRTHYHALLKQASEIIHVSIGTYTPLKMLRRNQWMIESCDIVLAVWNGTDGGTANTVTYAELKRKPIRRIDPRVLTLSLQ